jgi:hypothetical protein
VFAALFGLADHSNCRWLISFDQDYHRHSFENGLTPAEYIGRLKAIIGSGSSGWGI